MGGSPRGHGKTVPVDRMQSCRNVLRHRLIECGRTNLTALWLVDLRSLNGFVILFQGDAGQIQGLLSIPTSGA
jgi:hypothetical protein